jgi:hypothetical protein
MSYGELLASLFHLIVPAGARLIMDHPNYYYAYDQAALAGGEKVKESAIVSTRWRTLSSRSILLCSGVTCVLEGYQAALTCFYGRQRSTSTYTSIHLLHYLLHHLFLQPGTFPMLFERTEALFGMMAILVNQSEHCEQNIFLPQAI